MTYLTVPIAAKDTDAALGQAKTALSKGVQAVELRTDYLKSLNSDTIIGLISAIKKLAKKPIPIIVTCRSKDQGGAIAYPDKLRINVLVKSIKAGADFVDLEYESFQNIENQEKIRLALSESSRTRLILSAHNFEGPFDDLAGLYRHITTTYPAAIAKLVYTANHINDCFEAMDLLYRTGDDVIAFCMGSAGLITRILAKKLGSLVTFACIEKDTATAAGQLTIDEFKKLYRYDSIDKDTQLFGVIGNPIEHSMSPAVFNACFDKLGLNCLYLPILLAGEKEQFNEFMYNIISRRWLGFKGFSVTIPHKQNALDFVRQKRGYIEPLAEIIGAANTLIIGPDEKISAHNTDYKGAMDAIANAGMDNLQDMSVAVIGAGGVARAIVAGLVSAGAKVTIYNRTVRKAERLAAEFNCSYAPLDELETLEADLLINCTSLGMFPETDTMAIPAESLKRKMVIFDTVYNPPVTKLLAEAKKIRAKTISGIDMFINQAAAQFKLFTGQQANTQFMRRVASRKLRLKQS